MITIILFYICILLLLNRISSNYFGSGYVITTNLFLPDDIQYSIRSCGFEPKLFPAIQPYLELYSSKEEMVKRCLNPEVIVSEISEQISLLELSLVCSHLSVIKHIAEDKKLSDSNYTLILEHDAKLNEKAVNVTEIVKYALDLSLKENNNNNNGFVYLGICGGVCERSVQVFGGEVGSDCHGACAHAYAITKSTAKLFTKYLYVPDGKNPLHTSFCADDSILAFLLHHSQGLVGHVAGLNLVSPDAGDHMGFMYQCNRTAEVKASGTNLGGKNDLVHQKCLRVAISPFAAHAMFQYAALVGVCVLKSVVPSLCAMPIFSDSSSLKNHSLIHQPLDSFIQVFEIKTPDCRLVGEEYHEVNTSFFDPKVLKLKSGTLLKGSFLSYRYFHTHAAQFVKDLFSFPIEVTDRANSFFENTRKLVPDGFQLVCLSLKKFRFRQEGHVWIDSIQFYLHALMRLLKLHGKIGLVLLYGSDTSDKSSYKQFHAQILKSIAEQYHNHTDKVVVVKEDLPIEDHFLIMKTVSLFPNIVISNSPQSWWSAYLCPKCDVFAPSLMQVSNSSRTSANEDYYLPEWNVLV